MTTKTMTAAVSGYSRAQIVLHWLVAALVLAQFLFKDTIADAWRALRMGAEPVTGPLIGQHVIGGFLILALVLWRLALRARRGAPPPPEAEHPALRLLARLMHGGLYLVLIGLVVSGGVAWFGGVGPAAGAHNLLKTLLMLLVGLHVAAALMHQFVLRSGVMARMLRAG